MQVPLLWSQLAFQALWITALLAFGGFFLHGFSASKLALLSFFAILAACHYRRLETPPAAAFGVLLGWVTLSAFWLTHPLDFVWQLVPFALIWLLYSVRYLGEQLRDASVFAGSLCGLGVLLSRGFDGLTHFGGMGNPNFAAHFMLATLCLIKPQALRERPWLWPLVLLQVAGILASASRAGTIGLFICAYFLIPRSHRRWALLLASVLLTLACLIWRHDLQTGWHYLRQPQAYVAAYRQQPTLLVERDPWFKGKRLSLMSRAVVYGNTAIGSGDTPLLGHGWGQFRVAYPARNGRYAEDVLLDGDYRIHAVHNLALKFVFELGLLGLAIAIWAFWQLWRAGSAAYRRMLLLQLMLALVSLNYLNPAIWALLAVYAPRRQSTPLFSRRWPQFVLAGMALMALLGLDVTRQQAAQAASGTAIPLLFAEERARHFYHAGNYAAAWTAQQQALRWDPHAPELWLNMAHIAWMMSFEAKLEPQEAAAWRARAQAWYGKVSAAYPDVRFSQPTPLAH